MDEKANKKPVEEKVIDEKEAEKKLSEILQAKLDVCQKSRNEFRF